MKLACSTVLLAGTLSLLSSSALAADGHFERTLKVNGPVLLGVDTDSGNIHVSPGPVSTIHILAHVHSNGGWFGNSSSADSRVKDIIDHPPINQAGNIVSIGHNFHAQNISIDYEITTPRGTDLRAGSGSGDLRVEDNGGPVELKTGSGNITASGLSDHVQLETGSGDITAAMMSVRDVKAQTGSGNISLKNVQSGLWAHTGSGNIDVTGKPLAAWKLETGSGNITADTAGAALSLNATTGSGDLSYDGGSFRKTSGDSKEKLSGDASGGGSMVRATTGSGNIHFR